MYIVNGFSNFLRLLCDMLWVFWVRMFGDYLGVGNNGNKIVYFMKGVISKVILILIDVLWDVIEIVVMDEIEIDVWDEDDFG